MNNSYLKVCAWGGPIFTVCFLVAFILLAGFLPPPSPAASAEAIAEFYAEHSIGIRSACVLMMLGFSFAAPFYAAITVRMRQMGNSSPALVATFAIATAAITAVIFVVITAWAAAAFRVDRSAELIQAFNDFAFLLIIWPGSIISMSYFALGFATISDNRAIPVFPRWFGFMNFWMGFMLYGGAILLFFKTGPFAWDGLFAFWIPAVAFFGWYIVTSIVLIKSINRDRHLNE
ncbi:hypothetical protein CXF71_11135 [Colwellia sp. 12G3]|nr:hypothetical protein CXF71_11135 [Colwellia sp. 12G3]